MSGNRESMGDGIDPEERAENIFEDALGVDNGSRDDSDDKEDSDVRDEVENIAQSIISFPPGQEPGSVDFLGQENLVGVMPSGVNTIDFTNGSLSFAEGGTLELRDSLQSIQEDFIQSLFISADDQVGWWSADQQAGGILDQGDTVRITSGPNRSLNIRELTVVPARVCDVEIQASTSRAGGFDLQRGHGVIHRTSFRPDIRSVAYPVQNEDYEEDPMTFAPESGVFRDNPTASTEVFGEAVSNFGITVENYGENPVELAIEASDSVVPELDVDDDLDEVDLGFEVPSVLSTYSELTGWERDNPQVIEGESTNTFSFDNWMHSSFRVFPRAPDGESAIRFNVTGKF